MARVEIPVGRREAAARSRFVSSQSLINAYVERDPEPEQADAIYGGPGLAQFADCANGAIRGMDWFNGALLAVSGDALYAVDSAGTATALGAIPGTAPVVMANNGAHCAVVSDSQTLLYNGATVAAVTDPDFRRAASVDFIRQTLVFSEYDSGRYFTSALADAASYDALDIATAETRPDKLVRVLASQQEVLLFGERGVEGLYYSGKPDGVPLSPTQTNHDYGLIGRDACARIDNTVAWIAHDKTVRTLRGGSPLSVADPAVTAELQSWSDLASVRAFAFSCGGHEWLALRGSEGCLLWDASTGLWSRRRSFGSDTWRAACAERAYGHQLLGDAASGKIWRVDADVYAEGADALVREFVSRTVGAGGAPFTLDAIELDIEVGVGLATGQGSAPLVWMQLSRDGGVTWGARMERSLGAMGARGLRVAWIGPFGDFPPHGGAIKFGVSDPVRVAITGAWADVTAAAI